MGNDRNDGKRLVSEGKRFEDFCEFKKIHDKSLASDIPARNKEGGKQI